MSGISEEKTAGLNSQQQPEKEEKDEQGSPPFDHECRWEMLIVYWEEESESRSIEWCGRCGAIKKDGEIRYPEIMKR